MDISFDALIWADSQMKLPRLMTIFSLSFPFFSYFEVDFWVSADLCGKCRLCQLPLVFGRHKFVDDQIRRW